MDWFDSVQKAIQYMEDNITKDLSYEEIAKQAFSSCFHFQRSFRIISGYTVGEYIRARRLTLAGMDLREGHIRVIEAAVKYGYDSPDAFSKAFFKFHGVLPSAASSPLSNLKIFHPLKIKRRTEPDFTTAFRIEEKPQMVLVGYKRHFSGVPFGTERAAQEEEMFVSTRGKQWFLRGAAVDYYTDYCIIKNTDDFGYDFYIANELNAWTRRNLYNKEITGVAFMESLALEEICIPKQTYVIFQTQPCAHPMEESLEIRRKLVCDWMANADYQFADAPELALIHWRSPDDKENRTVEIYIPIEKQSAKN